MCRLDLPVVPYGLDRLCDLYRGHDGPSRLGPGVGRFLADKAHVLGGGDGVGGNIYGFVMEHVESAIGVAKGISEFGIMIMICAVFLVLSASLMIGFFNWFKNIIERILKDFSNQLSSLQATAARNGEAMVDIAEGLLPETQLRIKNTSGVYFDLATEKVCRLIKRVREENHIADREATAKKIRTLLTNMYEDRNSRFDSYRYRGKRLSEYTNPEWVEWVAKVVEGELYNESGTNNGRAYTNVSAVYENIKLDFYHRLNG